MRYAIIMLLVVLAGCNAGNISLIIGCGSPIKEAAQVETEDVTASGGIVVVQTDGGMLSVPPAVAPESPASPPSTSTQPESASE